MLVWFDGVLEASSAELRLQDDAGDRIAALSVALAGRYPQYRDQPFTRVLVLRIIGVTGWAASGT